MEPTKNKNVLISGASIAGLSAAWWMNKLGYKVTVVELANAPRTAGAAVDIDGDTVEVTKRMGLFEQLKANRLNVEQMEFKNADNVTENTIVLTGEGAEPEHDNIEIERDKFFNIVFKDLEGKVEFMFNNSIAALDEAKDNINATFKDGTRRAFHLVLGCDGMHSAVRRIWFGHEAEYVYYLGAYFAISIVNKLLVKQKTVQMYNEPGRGVMLNAYNNKTDIIFCFNSDRDIPYDYRNTAQQRQIILNQFAGVGWRTPELLEEIQQADNFYFDKFCQVKMPSWTKGRVALVGDAGYCASPAAGKGASLSISGAAALADSLQKHNGDFEPAFAHYNKHLRPFIEEVQAAAELNVRENFIPRTEEAIRLRNAQPSIFS